MNFMGPTPRKKINRKIMLQKQLRDEKESFRESIQDELSSLRPKGGESKRTLAAKENKREKKKKKKKKADTESEEEDDEEEPNCAV